MYYHLKRHMFWSMVLLFSDFVLFVFLFQVLETCMKNCGKRFHSEVGKFRFLNELIKVVSPKVRLSECLSECVCVFQTGYYLFLHVMLCVNHFVVVLNPPLSTWARGHQSQSKRRFWS